jgi:hypothetical protein
MRPPVPVSLPFGGTLTATWQLNERQYHRLLDWLQKHVGEPELKG